MDSSRNSKQKFYLEIPKGICRLLNNCHFGFLHEFLLGSPSETSTQIIPKGTPAGKLKNSCWNSRKIKTSAGISEQLLEKYLKDCKKVFLADCQTELLKKKTRRMSIELQKELLEKYQKGVSEDNLGRIPVGISE